MSRLLGLLMLVVGLVVLRIALVVLAILLALTLTWAFIVRPRETLIFLGVLMASTLATAKPAMFIAGLTVVALAVVIAGARRGGTADRAGSCSDRQPYLIPPRLDSHKRG